MDRCIFETTVKIIWLCHSGTDEEFKRYLADGLKTELEFKARIEDDIAANGGKIEPLQARMLSSIDKHIAASGLTAAQIRSTPKQRDIAAMLDSLGYDRLFYFVAQKIGSHHVHGTWPGLLFH